jgi:cytochrome c oxidase cbb3-type subunit 3
MKINQEMKMSQTEDNLLEHNYDGILEYDNPLPKWWVWLFILTVIWGIGYFFYYNIAEIGPSQHEEYLAEFNTGSEDAMRLIQQMNEKWAAIAYVPITDDDALEQGKAIYVKNCVSCHGANGEGGIGPNMTDNYYIHGGGIENTMNLIINGVPEKGMISWKPLLTPEEVQLVASYILTLKGTQPANAKAPQGELWEQ